VKKKMTSNEKKHKSKTPANRGRKANTRRRNRGHQRVSVPSGGMSSTSSDSSRNYKTEMCNKWLERGECPYGNKCQFAHGESELRSGAKHLDSRYKQSVCRNFHEKGSCPYGKRCRFIHNETPEELELLRRGISPDQVCIVIGDTSRFSANGETNTAPTESLATAVSNFAAAGGAILPKLSMHAPVPPPAVDDLGSIFSESAPPSLLRQNSGVQDDILREVTAENEVSYMKVVDDEGKLMAPLPVAPLQRQSTTDLLLNIGKRRDNGVKRNKSLFFDIPASPGSSHWDWTVWQPTSPSTTFQKPRSGVLASVA